MNDEPLINISRFKREDQAVWMPLWQGYQTFYNVALAPEVTELTWSRFLDPAEPMEGALAWRGTEAVGLVHFIRHRSCWTASDYCYLQDLFVSPQARGGGIGRHLIEHVYEAAEAQGCSRVYWLTHETNTDAMALYNKVAARSGFLQFRKQLPREDLARHRGR